MKKSGHTIPDAHILTLLLALFGDTVIQLPKAVYSSAKCKSSKWEESQPMTGSSGPYIDPGKANSPSMKVTAQSFQEYYLRLFSILDSDHTVILAQNKQTNPRTNPRSSKQLK